MKGGSEGREPATYVGVQVGAPGCIHIFYAEKPQHAAPLVPDWIEETERL